jgi:hypothetical protein
MRKRFDGLALIVQETLKGSISLVIGVEGRGDDLGCAARLSVVRN